MAIVNEDIGAEIALKEAVAPQTYSDDTSDLDGDGIDRTGYLSCTFFIHKASGHADDDLTFTVQDSSDDSTYADFGSYTVQLTTAADEAELDVNLAEANQYIRVKLKSADATLGGASSLVAGSCTLGGADIAS